MNKCQLDMQQTLVIVNTGYYELILKTKLTVTLNKPLKICHVRGNHPQDQVKPRCVRIRVLYL